MKKLIFIIGLFHFVSSCGKVDSSKVEKPRGVESDTLSFELSEANNIIFKTVLEKTDTLNLFWDTGGTSLVLKHSTIKEKTSLLDDKNEDYKEENYVPLEGGYTVSVGPLQWDSLTIYPTSLLPKEADGHFGWNLFEGKIVELDYDKKIMVVHSSFSTNLDDYAKMEIEYINTLFCIKGNIQVGDNHYVNRYLFDSGFQRAVLLDKEINLEDKFPENLPVLKESRLRNAAGTEFINKVVEVDNICFVNVSANQIPVQLLATPNPARFKTHILGNELLKRFNTILDFQNNFIYLKPNSMIDLPYADAS